MLQIETACEDKKYVCQPKYHKDIQIARRSNSAAIYASFHINLDCGNSKSHFYTFIELLWGMRSVADVTKENKT